MRAFAAVPVQPPAHDGVVSLLRRLSSAVPGVRWVDGATVHITLHFFADLDEKRVPDVVDVLRRATTTMRPFGIAPEGLGSFPPRGRPRVLWLGLADTPEELRTLAETVMVGLADQGFSVDSRPFRPHITLGRPKRSFDDDAWRAARANPAAIAPFAATEVVLFESRHGHHRRATVPISAPAGPAAP
jgi:2'-5' RNA ligase